MRLFLNGPFQYLRYVLEWSIFFLSTLLRDCSLCWDRGNGTMMPTLDAALLYATKAGLNGAFENITFQNGG